jgi:hypothetical protein
MWCKNIGRNMHGFLALGLMKIVLFGLVGDNSILPTPDPSMLFPSAQVMELLVKDFQNPALKPTVHNAESLFQLSLAYGYPLSALSPKQQTLLTVALNEPLLYTLPIPQVNTAVAKYLFEHPPSCDISLPNHPEIVQLVKLCNKPLNALTDLELTSLTPRTLALYLRRSLDAASPKPLNVRQIRQSLLDDSGAKLWHIFSGKSDEEQKTLLGVMSAVFSDAEYKMISGKIKSGPQHPATTANPIKTEDSLGIKVSGDERRLKRNSSNQVDNVTAQSLKLNVGAASPSKPDRKPESLRSITESLDNKPASQDGTNAGSKKVISSFPMIAIPIVAVLAIAIVTAVYFLGFRK